MRETVRDSQATLANPVEVESERSKTSDTFDLGDGRFKTVLSSDPLNFKSGSSWLPIDNALVPVAAGGWKNAANSYELTLPATGDGVVRIASGSVWVSYTLVGALAVAGRPSGNTVRYVGVLPGVTLVYTATSSGVKETLELADASSNLFRFSVKSSTGVAFTDDVGGGLAVTSGKTDAFKIPAISVVDAAGAQALGAVSTEAGSGLSVTVSKSWLDSPDRAFPVEVDPTTALPVSSPGDCGLYSGSLHATSTCSYTTLLVGLNFGSSQQRSIAYFDTSAFTTDASILNADLTLTANGGTVGNSGKVASMQVDAQALTQAYTSSATYDTYNGSAAWPGSFFSSTIAASKTVTGPISGSQAVDLYPTSLVQSWVDGTQVNDGLILKADVETNSSGNDGYLQFAASGSTGAPVLTVVWSPAAGLQPSYSYTSRTLSDRTSLAINNGGTLKPTYKAHDVSINTPLGPDLNVDRFYTDVSNGFGTLGSSTRWLLSVGGDVHLDKYGDNTFDYIAPSGTAFRLTPSGATWIGTGLRASLTASGSDYVLTFHQTNEAYTFTLAGCSCSTYVLADDKDADGNHVVYSYSGASRQLGTAVSTTSTGTTEATLTFSYNASGWLSTITDTNVSGVTRTWTYQYDGSGNLQYYTDPSGAVTTYSYDASNHLTEIDNPPRTVSGSTVQPKTFLHYTASYRIDWVKYATNGTTGTDQFTFTYANPYNTICDTGSTAPSGTWASTAVTDVNDPQGGTTYFCYDKKDHVLRTIDGNGDPRDRSYNTNNDLTMFTDAESQASNLSYSGENLTSAVSSPASGGSVTGATTSFTYASGTYQPQNSTDAQGRCTHYKYNTARELLETSGGQGASCSTDFTPGAANSTTLTRYSNGSIHTIEDGNGNTTTLTYHGTWAVKEIIEPTGSCSAPRTLCTTYTWDGDYRPVTTTDGRGLLTTYTYDKLDRVTGVYTNGSTSCNGSNSNCVQYTYDPDGNVIQRLDHNGTTTYGFNFLNQPTSVALPSGVTTTATYDALNDMTSYTGDGGGTVTYGYNAADQLTSITDAGSATPITYDYVKGYRTKATFPGGTTLTFTHFGNGRPKAITPSTSTLPTLTYDYTTSSTDRNVVHTIQNSVTTNTTTYVYDALNRVTSETPSATGSTYSWAYDGAGNNLLSQTDTSTYSYRAYDADNQECRSSSSSTVITPKPTCATAGGTLYTYNADGDQTAGYNGFAIGYNDFEQVSSITPSTGVSAVSMGYDDVGNSQRTAAGASAFINGQLGTTKVTTGAGTLYVTREPSGALVDLRSGASTYYYETDANTNVVGLFTTTAKALYDYQAYGLEISQTQPGGSSVVHDLNPYRFASAYLDVAEGDNRYHMGARYYGYSTTLWLQQDTYLGQIADPTSGNRYAYTNGNPINGTDPNGSFSIGRFLEGVDFGLTAIAFGSLGIGTIVLSATLEPPSAGLSTLGIIAGVGILAGASATAAVSYESFREAF